MFIAFVKNTYYKNANFDVFFHNYVKEEFRIMMGLLFTIYFFKMHKRKTKIIATIGPTSESYETLEKLALAGMDIARMNFSHCTEEEFLARKEKIEDINKKHNLNVKILQDLQGPRIRVGKVSDEGVHLSYGQDVIFSINQDDTEAIFIDSKSLVSDIKIEQPLYLANGAIKLVVTEVDDSRIYARVTQAGVLYSRKSVNVPDTRLSLSGLTEKDKKDVLFGLSQGVDFVAISFVQDEGDVLELKEMIGGKAKVIAKMETRLSVDNMDGIIQGSDAIMIARGDLGVEIPVEELPFTQKHMIRNGRWHDTPAITATQMMLSMVNSPEPTRAEVSDVANAVYDGSSAVMLSDETASGKYPVEAVSFMNRIITHAESFKLGRVEGL